MAEIHQYSITEEIANAVSHGIGALLSVAGLTLLVTYAAMQQDAVKVTSFAIYGATLILAFLSSTLYHAFIHEQAKKLFKLFDHCSIYLLIAGTYTPLMLVTLAGTLGYTLLALIWTIAIGGIIFKVTCGHKYKITSLITYVGMGLLSLTVIHKLYQSLPAGGLALLAIGGACYLFGVIFYVQKRIPFNHAIWHLFVLAGAACHFFLMLFYV